MTMNNSETSVIESGAPEAGQPEAVREVFFRDIGLKVGDRLIIEPPPKLGDQPGTVKLIGYVNDLSVLVTMPDTRPWAGPPIEGDEFMVRAFSGRHAYGFSTIVGKRAISPFEYLHLQFPRRITVREIRNAERISTTISARILDAPEPIPTVVTNLSATGAAVRASGPVRAVGDAMSLELVLDIHKVRTRVVVSAVIRNANQLPDSGDAAYGVQFIDVNAQANIFLKSFVYQNLVEQPHKRL